MAARHHRQRHSGEMADATGRGVGTTYGVDRRHIAISINQVHGVIGDVHVTGDGYVDYLQLVHVDGRWQILTRCGRPRREGAGREGGCHRTGRAGGHRSVYRRHESLNRWGAISRWRSLSQARSGCNVRSCLLSERTRCSAGPACRDGQVRRGALGHVECRRPGHPLDRRAPALVARQPAGAESPGINSLAAAVPHPFARAFRLTQCPRGEPPQALPHGDARSEEDQPRRVRMIRRPRGP